MRCAELEELLSAYANSELSRTQKEFVEEHIANCADCREELESYTNVRRQIVSLRDTGGLQDIKEATMSAIKGWDAGKRSLKWLRPALAAVPVVAALAVLLAWQPWNPDPGFQSIMVKAQAATASLQSYRISLEVTTTNTDEETFVVKAEIEFAAPDRYHVKQTGDEDNLEYIFIGDKQYFKNSSASPANIPPVSHSLTISRDHVMAFWHSPIRVGLYLAIIGCHTGIFAWGSAFTSSEARLNSSRIPCAGIPRTCGSIGPRLDCFPISMLLQAHATIVPADRASWGTIARISVPKCGYSGEVEVQPDSRLPLESVGASMITWLKS